MRKFYRGFILVENSKSSKKKGVLHWVGEDVVQGELIVFGVVEDVVAVDVPAAHQPLVEVNVAGRLLGQLVRLVVVGGHLVFGIPARQVVVFVLVGRPAVASAECAN